MPGVSVPAILMTPLNVRAPLPLLLRLLYEKAGIVCATEPLKSIALPVMVWPVAVPGVNVPEIAMVPVEERTLLKLLKVKLP